MRRADISGLSVTMPHKADVVALVDECTAVAQRLGAVNCVVNRDGVLLGTNTDGAGFLASLARGAAFSPAGKRCLVIGAGGAARAVVLALADAGASHVAVLNRTPERAATAAALAGPAGRVVPAGEKAQVEVVQSADLVVNATPLGHGGRLAGPRRPGWWRRSSCTPARWPPTWSTRPARRRWLTEATAAGARSVDGLGMLVHQAAAQLVLWTWRARLRSRRCGRRRRPPIRDAGGLKPPRPPRPLRPRAVAGELDLGGPERGLGQCDAQRGFAHRPGERDRAATER